MCFFALICLFLAYFAVDLTHDLYKVDMNSYLIDNDDVDVTIDGADFYCDFTKKYDQLLGDIGYGIKKN